MPAGDSEGIGDAGAFAGEPDAGLTAGAFGDFDIGPGDSAAPAGAEDFEDGFLGGEASGEVLEISAGVGVAISLFGGGEDAVEKMPAVLLVEAANAGGFDEIDSVADDGHGTDDTRGDGKFEIATHFGGR